MDHAQDMLPHRDYMALSQEVRGFLKSQSWWQLHGVEVGIFLARVALFAGALAVFAQKGIWYKIIGLIVASYAYFGIGITGTHEASHGSFVKHAWTNRIWGYFFADFLTSQSSRWWFYRHVQEHHVYTNVPSKEPRIADFPWLNKHVYFFVTPYLVQGWLVFYSITYLKKDVKELMLYLVLLVAGWAFNIWLFGLFVSLPYAILCTFILRSLWAPVFVHIAVFNHIGLEHPKEKLPWIPHHTITTRNLKKHWFVSGIGGNAFVERHIEHHLFPTLSNRMLAKIHPVQRHLNKRGYKYTEEGYLQCLRNCLDKYDTMFLDADL